jgi:hypothetical protein
MTLTLANLVYRVGRAIGGGACVEGTATGGSSVTIADTVERSEADDYWNGGTAIILYDAGGTGAVPEGEFSVITDFESTGDTITLRTAFTSSGAVAAGDKYALIKRRYPLQQITQEINNSLQRLGAIPTWNGSGIKADSDQTEYSLPSAATGLDLRSVWIQSSTDDTNDNRWLKLSRSQWRIQPSATGTANILVLSVQPSSGIYIGLEYLAPHAEMRLYSDKLNDVVYPDRVVYEAAAGCLRWYMDKSNDEMYAQQYERLKNMAAEAVAKHPIPIPQQEGKLMIVSDSVYVQESEVNKVYV